MTPKAVEGARRRVSPLTVGNPYDTHPHSPVWAVAIRGEEIPVSRWRATFSVEVALVEILRPIFEGVHRLI